MWNCVFGSIFECVAVCKNDIRVCNDELGPIIECTALR